MNPNSKNQIWSKWTFTVTPGVSRRRTLAEVRAHCARFGRKAFGAASAMRITRAGGRWTIEVRTEGHPVHESAYVDWMQRQWAPFFVNGFGLGTVTTCTAKLEAGDRQDGTPADQLIILPTLSIHEEGVRYGD
jgi:hypothetical protein